jgi:hypothetical protein
MAEWIQGLNSTNNKSAQFKLHPSNHAEYTLLKRMVLLHQSLKNNLFFEKSNIFFGNFSQNP